MTQEKMAILETARNFVKALEEGKAGDELEPFCDPDIVQTEYPNALIKTLCTRNLQELKEASMKGKKILFRQHYDIVASYVQGNTVVMESVWTGILAIPIGQIPAGGEMKAYFAQFFEFRNGKIFRLRNYDCFESF